MSLPGYLYQDTGPTRPPPLPGAGRRFGQLGWIDACSPPSPAARHQAVWGGHYMLSWAMLDLIMRTDKLSAAFGPTPPGRPVRCFNRTVAPAPTAGGPTFLDTTPQGDSDTRSRSHFLQR